MQIHETAQVHPHARVGTQVTIGAYSIIGADAVIGDRCTIESHCTLATNGPAGEPLHLGPDSIVRSHSIIYRGSHFPDRLETGHHVIIREHTRAGSNLRVGNFSDIEGDCTIGDFTRFHGYVHLGKRSRVGNFVWIFSLSTLTNDPLPPSEIASAVEIDDGAVICVNVALLPGSRLGAGAFATAGSTVRGSVPVGAVVSGPDGRIIAHVSQLADLASGTRHPWMRHFSRGYPPEAQMRLKELEAQIMQSRFTLRLDDE